MRKSLLVVGAALTASIAFIQCKHRSGASAEKGLALELQSDSFRRADKQDGIKYAELQDFEQTKDIALGYIPQDRLIAATEVLVAERRAKLLNHSFRTSALAWTERGPNSDAIGPSNGNTRGPGSVAVTSGRIRAVLVDLADPTNKTVWTGGVDGGLWKTNDITASPASWTLVNDFLSNLAVASICQDPTNTDIMYMGTGEKAFNVDAVRGGGIWKSTDHGVTWNLLPSTTGFWNISRIVCDANGYLYAAAIGNNSGIQRSTNGGATWTNISPTGLSLRVTELKLSSTGRMHIVCGYYNTAAASAGYRYTDNPATVTSSTWTTPATSFTPVNYNVEIATAGNTLYALPSNSSFETPTVYKSTDGGTNWAATPTSPPATGTNSNTDLSSGQGWYCIAVAVDPANPDNAIVGGLNTYRTTNGGATWTQVARWVGTTLQYVHADLQYAVWNDNQVIIASDGGLFYSANGGTTWADRNVGLRLKQFYSGAIHPTSANYFIAGAQDNGMHQMNNPDMGASTEFIGGDGAFSHIDQDQPQFQFGSYVYNVYRRSINSGSTWSTVTYNSASGQFINPSDYDDAYNKMYAADAAGKYVRWENPQTGSSFTSVSIPAFNGATVNHVMVSPNAANRVFFGTTAGRIVKVDNADLASPTATNITGSGMSASAVSCVAVGTTDNNLLATFSNYGAAHVWVTTTGGGAGGWTNISGNLPDIPVRWAMFHPYDNTRAILATEAGIFETEGINGAATVWTQNTSFPIVRTDMLQYRPSDGLVLAATHGRGLWTSVIPVPATYVQFSASELTRPEATSATTPLGCSAYTDYTVYVKPNRALSGAATLTLALSGGTAVQGVDFDFTTNGNFTTPSNVLTLPNGSAALQPVTIRIYDNPNASAGPNKTFTLTYTVSGTTDAVPAPSNQSFTFTITNDDSGPVVGGVTANYTLGTYSVNSSATSAFQSARQSHRLQAMFRASELAALGYTGGGIINSLTVRVATKNSTKPFTNFTVSLAQTTASDFSAGFTSAALTQVYTGNVTSVVGNNVFAFGTGAGSSSSFTWDGTSNIVVQFCFDNSPAAADAANDVMEGSNPDGVLSSSVYSNASGGGGCALAAASASVSRLNATFNITSVGNPVETALNASKTLTQAGNYDVYYYNGPRIIARIQNTSGFDYGCTQVTIDRAGNGASPFWSASPATHLATKTYRVVPTTNNPSGSYQITLYYTAAEKAAWEAATGNSWNAIQMVKVKSQISNYSPSTPAPDGANAVEIVTPVLGTFGADYTVTGTFTSGFSGFGVGIPGLNPLPVSLLDFAGKLQGSTAVLSWSTGSEQDSRSFDVEKSSDGVNFYKIGSVRAAGNSSTRKDYSLVDEKLSAENYYRLRMIDLNGSNKLSKIVLLRYDVKSQNIWVVNNPFTSYLNIRFAATARQAKLQLVNAGGGVVAEKTVANVAGQIRWDLPSSVATAPYVLRVVADGKTFSQKVVKN